MKFIKGEEYFYCTEALGLMKMTFHSSTKDHLYFICEDGRTKEFHWSLRDLIFESEDMALIKQMKTKTKLTLDNIEHHKEKLDKYNNILEDLNDRAKEMKIKYPEEFI